MGPSVKGIVHYVKDARFTSPAANLSLSDMISVSGQIELLALDLDGTLLDDAKRIDPATATALAAARRRGVRVVIASARPPRSVRHFYHALQLDTWQINYNGAMIWDEPGMRMTRHEPMDCGLVLQMIRSAREFHRQTLVTCEILDRWCTDRFDGASGPQTETGKLFRPDLVAPVEAFCVEPITKLLFLGKAEEMAELEAMLRRKFAGDVCIVRSEPELIQIMHRACSKGAALRRVMEAYAIAPDRVMAIGDAVNDLEMLRCAAVAVAVGNAAEPVKQAADWVAPDNNSQGVLAAMRRYGVCE